MPPRVRSIAALLIALAALLALTPGFPASAATRSADEQPPLTVLIDALTPSIADGSGTLHVQGRIVNNGRAPVAAVAVALRRSSAPLTSRRALDDVLQAPLADEAADVVLPSTRTDVTASLAPGSRHPFDIRIPLADAGFTDPGAYVLTIEASGQEEGVDSVPARKGASRTFLPWLPSGATITPLDVTWLWPLADWPARTAQGELLNTRTPTELAPGGRLDVLARLGGRYAGVVSWVVDPALLQTVASMTDGYEIVQPGGAVELGTQEADATRWLDTLDASTRDSTLRALPYADVDASALTRAGMVNDVVRAVTAAPGVARAAIERPVTGAFAWAPFGRFDRPTLDVLSSAGVTTVVMSAEALPATESGVSTDGSATAALPTSTGSIRAVLIDPALSSAATQPTRGPAETLAARQRFLSETLVMAQTLPADQAMRTVVIAPASARWNATASLVAPLLRATEEAPWLASVSLDSLLDKPVPSISRVRGGYGPRARTAELTAEYMDRVKRTSRNLDAFTSIIDDPTGISEPYSQALLRAESSAWRTEPDTGSRLVSTISSSLAEQTALVRVLSEGTITFSGDTGRVPITIQNDLDRSVTVGVTLRGQPQLRLSSVPLTGIRIEAGRMASVDIDARVVGGDPLDVSVQLLGPEGQDYGRPARITVTSTAYSRAAAWVVALAFLAIAVFVVVGIVRRIRAARR